jgi:hypothetical protein
MSIKLPPLEPTRAQRLLILGTRHMAGMATVTAVFGVIAVTLGAVMVTPPPNGLGHPWMGLPIVAIPVALGLVLAYAEWGPWREEFPGNPYDSWSAGYWVQECQRTWMKIPAADRPDLLPVMQAVYGLGHSTRGLRGREEDDLLDLVKDRHKLIKDYKAAAEERENLTVRPWLMPGARDMDDARAKLEMLREQNKTQRDAQESIRTAYEDLTNPGSV